MNDFMWVLITDAIILVAGFLIPTILLRGFFWPFFKVKTSLGRLVLVEVHELNRNYFKPGEIIDGFLTYLNQKKEACRHKVPTDVVVLFRRHGVTSIEVDAESGNIRSVNWNAVSGFDSVKFEELYERALYKPEGTDPLIKIILGVLILQFLVTILVAFQVFPLSKKIDALSAQVTELVNRMDSGTILSGRLTP